MFTVVVKQRKAVKFADHVEYEAVIRVYRKQQEGQTSDENKDTSNNGKPSAPLPQIASAIVYHEYRKNIQQVSRICGDMVLSHANFPDPELESLLYAAAVRTCQHLGANRLVRYDDINADNQDAHDTMLARMGFCEHTCIEGRNRRYVDTDKYLTGIYADKVLANTSFEFHPHLELMSLKANSAAYSKLSMQEGKDEKEEEGDAEKALEIMKKNREQAQQQKQKNKKYVKKCDEAWRKLPNFWSWLMGYDNDV